MAYKNLNPVKLFKRIKNKEEKALRYLFQLHKLEVYPAARRLTKSDHEAMNIVNDAWGAVRQEIDPVKSFSELKRFLKVNAGRAILEYNPNKKKEQTVKRSLLPQNPGDYNNPEARLIRSELDDAIDRNVDKLPPPAKTILRFYRAHQHLNLSFREMGRLFGCQASTIEKELRVAYITLNEMLAEQGFV